MDPTLSPSTTFVKSITIYTIPIYYRWRVVQRSLCNRLSPRRPDPRIHGHYRRYATGKSRSSAVLGMPRGTTFLKFIFESSPFQTQQRWVERPLNPSLPLIISASYPAAIPPFIPSQRSTHRYCAWILPVLPPSTPSRCFTLKGVEAMDLIEVLTGAQSIASLTLLTLNCFHALCQKQGKAQDLRHLGLYIWSSGFHPYSSADRRLGDFFSCPSRAGRRPARDL